MAISSKMMKLSTGAKVSVNDHRVRVDLPSLSDDDDDSRSSLLSYQSISSAILNGGYRIFDSSSSSLSTIHIINYKVPSTYDGFNPSPVRLLTNFSKKENIIIDNNSSVVVVGMLTAASTKSYAHSSRSAMGSVSIDVIVTAGLSNSRSVGVDADYFVIRQDYTSSSDDDDNDDNNDENEGDRMMIKPGAINTIIIVNAPLTQEAHVEAYAIAVEAKCQACVDHGVSCSKDPTKFAMGTGTDCTVLFSQRYKKCNNNNINNRSNSSDDKRKVIKHAGKHTLFGEMIGQAVYEATSKAIMTNILHLHYNYATYTIYRWYRACVTLMMGGAMPLIPPKPMMSIPSAPLNVVLTGLSIVLCIYFFVPGPADNTTSWSTSNPKLLMSAVAWDRYLREPPLRFHPVCIAGSLISACLVRTPDWVYKRPILGFICGLMLLFFMVLTMSLGAWFFLESTEIISMYGLTISQKYLSGYSNTFINHAIKFTTWMLRVLLLKSTFSLQLLCTIALQMAKFIERDQIDDARGQLSWLCSRDPSKLGPSDLAGATLESLSENLSDGFVAPLFWYVLLGPIGALAYRVINTLDSRIGYRGKYEWFGKPSARLDDIINYIPARITTILLALSASILLGRESARKGIQTAWRDHQQCESPNAGWPMACFAGLLDVQLKKEGAYCLGSSSGKEPTPVDIRTGNRVAVLAGGMSLLLAMITAKMMA